MHLLAVLGVENPLKVFSQLLSEKPLGFELIHVFGLEDLPPDLFFLGFSHLSDASVVDLVPLHHLLSVDRLQFVDEQVVLLLVEVESGRHPFELSYSDRLHHIDQLLLVYFSWLVVLLGRGSSFNGCLYLKHVSFDQL